MADVLVIAHQYMPWHPRVRVTLEAAAQAGLRVDVVCLRDEAEPFREDYRGTRLYRLPVRRHRGSGLLVYLAEYAMFFVLATIVAAWLHVRRRHPVVVVHSLPDPLVFAASLPKLLGARVILNLHEFTPELFQTRYSLPAEHPVIRLSRLLESASCAFADHVITVHETGLELLAGRGVPARKLTVVTNAVHMGAGVPERPGRADRLTLLYHGLMGNEYDLFTVLESMHLLRRSDRTNPVVLRIVGDGPLRAELQSRAAALGLPNDRVVFEDPIPFEQIGALLAECDAGVALMRDTPYAHLGLPTKLLECVAAGLPVISTPGRAIRRHLPEGTLTYVDFADPAGTAAAIDRLLSDPGERAARAARAWRAVYPIRREAMTARYAALLRRAAGGAAES